MKGKARHRKAGPRQDKEVCANVCLCLWHANDLPVRSSAFPVALGRSLLFVISFWLSEPRESHFLLLFPYTLQVPPSYPLAGLLFSILLPRQLPSCFFKTLFHALQDRMLFSGPQPLWHRDCLEVIFSMDWGWR